MAFILSKQLNLDSDRAFESYKNFLEANKDFFPPQAFALATSDWYYNPQDHQCPHDGWLENIIIKEPATGTQNEIRKTSLRIRLLGAYHDGFIEFFYPQVFSYSLNSMNCEKGHSDWLYDEFRLSSAGRLIHEIEWSGYKSSGNWVIEASDVEFKWLPK
ncbi:MAG TPA: hypothetical protein VEF04_17485 [Blastocatellia bacterium]|nr:hypothetical protein [Blastocatellia bacterium]